ncbi:MAG: BglII/BstYI family type II restriction endonuclease [Armatimonadota bacterium]
MFDDDRIPATLRTIANGNGSVQVKYENRLGEPFRAWLSRTFAATLGGARGEYFEVHAVDESVFRILAFPLAPDDGSSLQVEQWLLHQGATAFLEQDTPLAEIAAVVRDVPFRAAEGQAFYNQAISASFASWSWSAECRVFPDLALKCDFAKDGAQVEVEFGNARTYYQDFTKFLLGKRYGQIEVGVLLVPTLRFAKHLCEVGRQRAVAKGRARYSGMIHFDKVQREFQYLEFMLQMPIAVAGIGSSAV